MINKIKSFLGYKLQPPTSIEEWEERLKNGVNESAQKLLPYLSDNSVFIDIGANIGCFTDIMINHKQNIIAHLFEPVPQYYLHCLKKYQNNKNIFISNFGLSDTNGEFSLWVDDINLGWNTMIQKKINGSMKEITIETVTFDDYVNHNAIKQIDVMKIDVEGAEFKVFKGMRNTLSNLTKKPVILCEIGWGTTHPNWNEEVEMFEWLFNHGYKRFDYTDMKTTTDVLFIPS